MSRLIVIFLCLFTSSTASAVIARTYCVDDTSDGAANGADCEATCVGDNDCSFRDAITAANANPIGDEINLTNVSGTIALTSALPIITEAVDIFGPGADQLTIDADGGNRRVLNFDSGGNSKTFLIDSLTVTGSMFTGTGAGIRVDATDSLTVEDSVVTLNTASVGGGGIDFRGDTLTVRNSTISDNTANGAGSGGIGVFDTSGATILIENSTISGNTTNFDTGGGLNIKGSGVTVDVDIVNSTITGNSAVNNGGGMFFINADTNLYNVTLVGNSSEKGDGGGISFGGSIAVTLTMANTIIANNIDEEVDEDVDGPAADCKDEGTTTTLISNDYNLIEDVTGCIFGGTTTNHISSQDPLLEATLADNGGPTLTRGPLKGSPIIDAGNPSGCKDQTTTDLTVDQRGSLSPQDGNNDGTSVCDIGAFEVGPCGDGAVDTTEECDNGASNSDSEADACRTSCVNPSCGDNVVDAGEDCDDGNVTAGDGCAVDCTNESGGSSSCGDGFVDSGEQCDDGNTEDGDGCAADCTDEAESTGTGAVSSGGCSLIRH